MKSCRRMQNCLQDGGVAVISAAVPAHADSVPSLPVKASKVDPVSQQQHIRYLTASPHFQAGMSHKIVLASVAAFCDGNRGIGMKGGLPWPYLKEDHQFYIGLCKTTKDPNKKNGIIMGRNIWDTWDIQHKSNPKMVTVVTSSTMTKDQPYCRGVARDFDEAVQMFHRAPDSHEFESIYILGGRKNYEHGVSDPRCTLHILTRIFQDFESDVFFPEFEHAFHRVSHPEIDDRIREDPANGIKFRFEVWEKNTDKS